MVGDIELEFTLLSLTTRFEGFEGFSLVRVDVLGPFLRSFDSIEVHNIVWDEVLLKMNAHNHAAKGIFNEELLELKTVSLLNQFPLEEGFFVGQTIEMISCYQSRTYPW